MGRITAFLLFVFITSVSIISEVPGIEAQEVMSKVVITAGHNVWLFHSGTHDVLKEICLNDILPLYREEKVGNRYKIEEVGKVQVLSYQGRNYFKGKVVSGEARIGDIATKKTASCMVAPPR